jgi:hypothetical protein
LDADGLVLPPDGTFLEPALVDEELGVKAVESVEALLDFRFLATLLALVRF